MTNDELNTWRSLKGDALLITSKWCKVGFHTWTKWSEPVKATTRHNVNYYQISECVHCNAKRKQKIDYMTGALVKE